MWVSCGDNGNPTTYAGANLNFNEDDHLTNIPNKLTMGYSSDGSRVWKQDQYGNRTYFLYDGDHIICELDTTGAPKVAYGWGANGLMQTYFVQLNHTPTVAHQAWDNMPAIRYIGYTYDPTGNVVMRHAHQIASVGGNPVIDNFFEDVVYYDAFGNRRSDLFVNLPYEPVDSVGYKGQFGYYTDPELSYNVSDYDFSVRSPLMLLGMRFYDPSTGRFLNRDPIGYDGGINVYAYCENDPVNNSDPSGLQTTFVPGTKVVVDPKTLIAGRSLLNAEKVSRSYQLFTEGKKPLPITINQNGVIYDGNSRARAAAELGKNLDAHVVDYPMEGHGPIGSRPFFGGSPAFNGSAVANGAQTVAKSPGLIQRIGSGIGNFFKNIFRGPRSPGSGGGLSAMGTIATGAGVTADGIKAIAPYSQTTRRLMKQLTEDPVGSEIPDHPIFKPYKH